MNDVLRALAATGLTHVVVVPNGFVCDHGEVLYDLDVQATLGGLVLAGAAYRGVGCEPQQGAAQHAN